MSVPEKRACLDFYSHKFKVCKGQNPEIYNRVLEEIFCQIGFLKQEKGIVLLQK